MSAGRYVGASVTRVEDGAILTGRGRYVDDLNVSGLLHAAFVRSPHPHARIAAVDPGRAARAGAVRVVTGRELAEVTVPMQVSMEFDGYHRPPFAPLAVDRARYVGDPVALVVARSRAVAEDAAEAVEVDYEPLEPVASAEQGLDPSAPVLFEQVGSNVLYRDTFRHGDPDAAFAAADGVLAERISQQRVANVPMEGRVALADFDASTGQLVLHSSTQSPHSARLILADALGYPSSRIRVIAPNVGGGFGQKIQTSREDVALCAASRLLGRPVKWVEDRIENLTTGGHAREEWIDAEIAFSRDGLILGLRGRMVLDHGAYPVLPVAAPLFTHTVRVMLPGPYVLPALELEEVIVATCKASYVPYRGPWAMECLLREVLLDLVAHELGLEPAELRRRNLITADRQPTRLPTGPTVSGISAAATLERAVELVAPEEFRADQTAARAEGRMLGLGIATLLEPAPGPSDFSEAVGFDPFNEPARVRLEPDGAVTLFTAQAPNGQGHETTLAQLVADELGVALDAVRVLHGDTQSAPYYPPGTGGSRSAAMATGSALLASRALRQQILELAGETLEVAPEDLELIGGQVAVRGAPGRSLGLAEVADAAYSESAVRPPGREPGLVASAEHLQEDEGWSQATHACVVEVDRETGQISIVRYVVVEDCGPMINPAIVEGQIRGGVAQGIGAALYERAAYDESANFVSATLMDYLVPTAMEIPPIEIHHLELAGRHDRDFRGIGEGGAMAAPPAVVNAVADALGARVTATPVTPEEVLRLLGG